WLLVTSAGRVIFCWLIVILAGDLVPAGRLSFLLVAVVTIHSCWSCDFLLVASRSCWSYIIPAGSVFFLLRIATLEAKLKATKILHRDAVVLFAKRIKKLGSKLKTKKRKLVLSDSENEEDARKSHELDALLNLANAALHEPSHSSTPFTPQSSSGLDFLDAAIPAVGRVSVGGADPAVVILAGGVDPVDVVVFAGGADPADVVVSAGGADSIGTLISAAPSEKELVDQQAAIFEAERQELLEQELKQSLDAEQVYLDSLLTQRVAEEQERESRASTAQSTQRQAELDKIALNLTNEEWISLVDQVWANPILSAELLGADVSEDTFSIRMVDLMNQRRKAIADMKAKAKRDKPLTPAQQKEYMRAFVKNQSTAIYTTGWTWKDVRGLTEDQLQNVYNKIRRSVDPATAKDHHQQLKRLGETLESSESKKLKSSHSIEQSAELHDTTSVSAGATIAVGDPISAVLSVSAASSIPAETLIPTGVSTTAGSSESASVPIIDLLDSPPKATSLPLDPATAEQAVSLRKSIGKKSMARRRTLPRPSQSESAGLPFDEDDPKAEFKKYLRQVFDDDEPADPVSLSLVFDIRRADLMVLYGMVSDKYKLERATGIGLGLWSDLWTLITAREDRDAFIIWDDQDQWEIQS
nr:hypothetical protein [Tanacetum cinerariifolium]